MGALAFALAALQAVPAIIAAGADVVGFITQTATAVTAMQVANRDPTQAEWDALNAQIAGLQKELDAG